MPILILLLFLALLWPSDSFLPIKPIRNAVMRRYVGLERGLYLETMIAKKRVEVSNLLRRHSDPSDDLMMRMTYVATKNNGNMTKALRRPAGGDNQHSASPPAWTQTQTQNLGSGSGSQANAGLHTMSLVIDMKRRSPTNPDARRVMEFDSAGHYAKLLAQVSVDALLINTEEMEYGGKPTAQALEHGATGILLIACVVGGDLQFLLDACTLMGTEALIEVHTPEELKYALSLGGVNFILNRWDRLTGVLYPEQARLMAAMFPMNTVNLVAGGVQSLKEVGEFGLCGYDGVVIGRHIAELPDIKEFIDAVHNFRGLPRDYRYTMGFKAMPGMFDEPFD